jgi:ArsR family transcriptional regulator
MRIPVTSSECSEKLKVLADATRLAVVEQLLAGPKRVGELQAKIRVEQSLLSHHLGVLREAGLVVADRDGKSVRYRIAPDVVRAVSGNALDLGCCRLSFGGKQQGS